MTINTLPTNTAPHTITTVAPSKIRSTSPAGVADVTPSVPEDIRNELSVVAHCELGVVRVSLFGGNAALAPAMHAAGFEYLTLPCADDPAYVVSGWVCTRTDVKFPPPPSAVLAPVSVLSDTKPRPNTKQKQKVYTVMVQTNDPTFKTHACDCEAGKEGTPCKHLYRAQVIASGAFKEARAAILAKGVPAAKFDAAFMTRCKEAGINGAISLVVKAGLGAAHPFATLPQQPSSPRYQLSRYLAKQAVAAAPVAVPNVE